ncbi:fizzy-related protein homolog [Trichosurus vulpecula]|uniref:fizzy-related protein homolog n=1 Tax=Trichosurus vulpecula TaxID=9337 RepID=UPI00186B32EF|nr:fizzy-related protein homolog [Trichosurus vulpecula]
MSKHGDRYIPSRAGAKWSLHFHSIDDPEKSPRQKQKEDPWGNGKDKPVYSALLKNELLEAEIQTVQYPKAEAQTPGKSKNLFTVTRLFDLCDEGDSVTSVGWYERGNLLAVGTQRGFVQIWDVDAKKKVSTMEGHKARVGALAWYADQISSGSRDTRILQRDIRACPLQSQRWLQGHKQEVCGLRWSTDHQLLASGGNDNKLLVWNHSSFRPVQQYTYHKAAVKAIAWSPHQHGLLASGGGSADRCIRFWNTLTGQPLQRIDTGSQVCNLAWSRHDNELVSTHGYAENQIAIWKYPSLTQIAKLTGHLYRVLYLAVSPDGQAIVTGAGDKSLRFWNVFRKARSQKESGSVLSLFTRIR